MMKPRTRSRFAIAGGAVLLIVLWAQLALALSRGQAFVGVNSWNVPIGAYTNLAGLLVGTPVWAILAFRHWR